MFRLFLSSLLVLGLTACHAHHPKSVTVDGLGTVHMEDGNHKGQHCPPGHAKKGWC